MRFIARLGTPALLWAWVLCLAPTAGGLSAGGPTAGNWAAGIWAAGIWPAAASGAGPGTDWARSWWWGPLAAVLICLIPYLIVTILERGGDMNDGARRLVSRFGFTPVVAAAGALMFGTLRGLRWLDGPLSLAAVIFAMIGGYAAVLVAGKISSIAARPRPGRGPDWTAVSLGGSSAAAVLLFGPWALATLVVTVPAAWARLRAGTGSTAARFLADALLGALVCGGLCALLAAAARS